MLSRKLQSHCNEVWLIGQAPLYEHSFFSYPGILKWVLGRLDCADVFFISLNPRQFEAFCYQFCNLLIELFPTLKLMI